MNIINKIDLFLNEIELPKKKWVEIPLSNLEDEFLQKLWDMYEISYKGIGLSIKNINEMKSKYKMSYLIDIDTDEYPDAFIIYKETGNGRKLALMGSDGKKESKKFLISKSVEIIKDKSKNYYAEASHGVADIFLKNNVNVVNDQATVERVLGKEVNWLDDDGKYIRFLKGVGDVEKRLFGFPR